MGLIIDPEFEELMPRPTPVEYAGLEKSIRREGCRVPIDVWQNRIADGYNRYEICTKHGIPYKVNDVDLPDRAAVKEWIIDNQLARRNLNDFRRVELAEKKATVIKEAAKERQRQAGGDRKSAEYKARLQDGPSAEASEGSVCTSLDEPIDTLAQTARTAGVSRTQAAKVLKILKMGSPALLDKARRDEISIDAAYKAVRKNGTKTLVQAAEDGDVLIPQQERMLDKFKRWGELEEQGVYIGSVWSFEKRADYAGDAAFPGNSAPQVIANSMLPYTDEGDVVLDPMAGSGTIIEVCKVLNRECLAFDLTPQRNDIQKANAADLPLEDESVDLVFWHPPYWNMINYGGGPEDLSKMSWQNFLSACRDVLDELCRVLKPGGTLVILSGDKVQDGDFYPITRHLANMAEAAGFVDCGVAIKLAHNTTSQRVKGKTIYAEVAYTGNLLVEHDTVGIFRKQTTTDTHEH